MDRKNVLFVHIPKTGGTSIRHVLVSKGMDKWRRDPKFIHHDSLINLEKSNDIPEDTYKFSVVRNPYTRNFSYYKHFKRINRIELSFYDFAIILHDLKLFSRNPMIPYTQSYYLVNSEGLISLDKIYKFENLSEFENDFGVKLPYLNRGGYSKDEYEHAYSDNRVKNFVKQKYLNDFINFGYSLEFESSLEM